MGNLPPQPKNLPPQPNIAVEPLGVEGAKEDKPKVPKALWDFVFGMGFINKVLMVPVGVIITYMTLTKWEAIEADVLEAGLEEFPEGLVWMVLCGMVGIILSLLLVWDAWNKLSTHIESWIKRWPHLRIPLTYFYLAPIAILLYTISGRPCRLCLYLLAITPFVRRKWRLKNDIHGSHSGWR